MTADLRTASPGRCDLDHVDAQTLGCGGKTEVLDWCDKGLPGESSGIKVVRILTARDFGSPRLSRGTLSTPHASFMRVEVVLPLSYDRITVFQGTSHPIVSGSALSLAISVMHFNLLPQK